MADQEQRPVDPTSEYMARVREYHEASIAGLPAGPPPRPPDTAPAAPVPPGGEDPTDAHMRALRERAERRRGRKPWEVGE